MGGGGWCGLLVNQSCTPLSLWYIRVLSESWGFLRAIPKVLRFLSLTVPQSPLLLFRQTASRARDPERVSDEARSRDSVTLTKGTLLAQIHHEIHCRLESSARRFSRTLSCSQLKTSTCPPPTHPPPTRLLRSPLLPPSYPPFTSPSKLTPCVHGLTSMW